MRAAGNPTYGPWRSAPIRGGGYLQQVVFAPSDYRRLYLTSDVGGLFRSDDGGKTWRMLHGALPADAGSYSPRGIAVHPRNADRVLVGLGNAWGKVNGVWLSIDGGDSWKQTLAARFEGNGDYRSAGNVVVLSPHNPDLVLAGPLGGGIRRSGDGGRTWARVGPEDLSPTHILFDRSDARRVWLCALPWSDRKLRGGLFCSEDAGRTWSEISAESPGEMVQDPSDPSVLFGIVRPKQIVRSTDGGRTWVRHSEGLAPFGKGDAREDGTYEALCAGPDFLLAGGHGGHIYRLDGDKKAWREVKWEKVEENDWWGRMRPNMYRHFGSAMGFVAVSPHDPRHWAFTDWYALYQSRDAGKTWSLTLDGIEMTVINTVAQEPTDPNAFHAGMADLGYFRSPDGGRTMRWITTDISSNIKTVAAAPAQPGRLYATGPREWQWQANELFVSDDAGLSWRRSGLAGIPGMDQRRSETVAAHPTKRDEVWITVSGALRPGEGGPWRSGDGGRSWTWQGRGLPEIDHFFRKDYWVAGPELAVSGDGSLVATSNDRRLLARRGPGDDAWTMLDLPDGAPNCVAADPLRPGRFYLALQSGGLWRSDDGGRTWKNVVDRDVHWVAADLRVKNRVAAVTPTGALVSADAGATWREIGRELPYRHSRNVVCFAGERVVVGTGGNGVFVAPLSALRGAATPRARKAATVAVAPDHPRIRYVGRFDRRNPAGPRCAWSASTIALRLEGTDLAVRLGDGGQNRWQIEVDGAPTTVLQTRPGEHAYAVASGLPAGAHTIRLVKATEALFGPTQILGFQLSRGGKLLPPPAAARRIEVIGDSISAGFGNQAAGKEERFSPKTENAYLTYGAIAARGVGAEYVCIAWSGKKMWPDNTLPELYDRILPGDPASRWDFGKGTPDVVLINLATNDFAAGNPDQSGWTGAYKAFLARVRRNYPRAEIYCAIGPMMGDWGTGKPLTTLRRYLAEMIAEIRSSGDAGVRLIDFGTQDARNGFGADWHPNVKTHRIMAGQFVQALRKDLGWSPRR